MPMSSKPDFPTFSLDPIDNAIKHLHSAAQSAAGWNDYWHGTLTEPPSVKLSYHINPDDSRLIGTLKRMFKRGHVYAKERLNALMLAFCPLRAQLEHFALAADCATVESAFLQLLNAKSNNRPHAIESLRAALRTIFATVLERENGRGITRTPKKSAKVKEQPLSKGAKRDKNWRQADAAKLAHISVRELRRWDRGENTPAGYPGWRDSVTFKAWLNAREGKSRLNRALKNHASYQEGVTEKYQAK